MELTLQREEGRTATPGALAIDGAFVCYTLEDPIRERTGMPVAMWKIPGRTAIPAGRYRLVMENSARFGANTMTLKDVPGFTSIRIHGGNTADDTEGCPLVGDQLQGERIVAGTSKPALERLKARIRAALDGGAEVWLEIRNPQLRA